jgi:hypothetical protein
MAEPSTRTGPEGQPQYRDSKGDWHDSPTTPATSSDESDESDDGGTKPTRTISAPTGNARTVAGLMGLAMLFSVIGAEIKALEPAKGGVELPAAFSEPFIIIAGGTVATVALVVIADLGQGGRKFAVAFAGLAMVTAVLVNGGPVWSAILNLTGGKATGETGSTTPTGSSSPTGRTSTTPATTATRPSNAA